MSVLTQQAATPSRIAALARSVEQHPGISRDDLINLMLFTRGSTNRNGLPPGTADGNDYGQDGSPAAQTAEHGRDGLETALNVAIDLGVVAEHEGGRTLNTALEDTSPEALLDWLVPRLLVPATADRHQQSEVPKAVAWLLEQQPRQPLPLNTGVTDGAVSMPNATRLQQFAYWAQYIGVAKWIGLRGGSAGFLLPDPSHLVRRALRAKLIIGERKRLRLLPDLWATDFPVLDGGSLRQQPATRDGVRFSPTTSLALLHLMQTTEFALHDDADADSVTLQIGAQPKRFSHIERLN